MDPTSFPCRDRATTRRTRISNGPIVGEWSASLEHDLGHNLSIRGLFLQKSVVDTTVCQRTQAVQRRTTSSLSRARSRGGRCARHPQDDGGNFTIYDYPASLRGAAFVNNVQQNTDRVDIFRNYEVTLNRRQSGQMVHVHVVSRDEEPSLADASFRRARTTITSRSTIRGRSAIARPAAIRCLTAST